MRSGKLLVVVVVMAIFASSLSADDTSRPCGPDSMTGPMRLLIPQGVSGADFRPACRRHDACYDTPGANKAACDKRYLKDMQCACKNSKHPVICRIVARIMHRTTSKSGDRAFAKAQAIALGQLGR